MPEKETETLERVKENIREASKQLACAVIAICELMRDKGEIPSDINGASGKNEDLLAEIHRLTEENEKLRCQVANLRGDMIGS